MKCPHCGNKDSRVVETRENSSEDVTRRRRECKECGDRFTTYERIETPALTVVKNDGSTEPFQTEKLKDGIEMACQKRDVSEETIDQIIKDIELALKSSGRDEVKSREIGDRVVEKLKDIDEVAYVRFASVYNSFEDVSAFEKEVETLKANT